MSTDGRIYDIGYQRYEGPRGSRYESLRALYRDGMFNMMGLGRIGRDKVIPWVLIGFIIFSLLIATTVIITTGDVFIRETVADFYGLQVVLLFMFIAILGTESVCIDKQFRILSLYLVKPFTALDYAAARWASIATLTFALAIIPQMILFILILLTSSDTSQFWSENWTDLPAFTAASLIITVFYSVVALLVATLAKSRLYTTVILLGIFFIGQVISTIAVNIGRVGGGISGGSLEWAILFHVGRLPLTVSELFLRENQPFAALKITVFTVLLAVCIAFIWNRYRKVSL